MRNLLFNATDSLSQMSLTVAQNELAISNMGEVSSFEYYASIYFVFNQKVFRLSRNKSNCCSNSHIL